MLFRSSRLGIPEAAFVVGIVATLRSWKGHRYLVDAVSRIQDAGVWLVMVGDGPGRPYLDEQCRSLGMNQVIMPGNQRNVEEWLQAFDVFVLPSYANEGVPQALMQAMACGLPVLTTPVGAIPEIVTDGSTGLMVTPRNADSLRDGIVRLRDDPGLRERLSLAALERARERFSMERMLDAMERIFAGVVPVHA